MIKVLNWIINLITYGIIWVVSTFVKLWLSPVPSWFLVIFFLSTAALVVLLF